MAKILIVDDDRALADMLKDFLTLQNHAVEAAYDGNTALEFLRCYKYDLIVLDWSMPGQNGIDVLKQFKVKATGAPVLFLTARTQLQDKVEGLEAGADDYLTKPINLQEFAARVRALLRRATVRPQKSLRHGDIILEPSSGQATRGQRKMALARKECDLLALLMQQPGQYLSTEALLDRLWEGRGSRASLANCLKRLRQQLNKDGEPDVIETSPGFGYRLKDGA